MSVMVELGGIYTNPDLVETVEAVVAEQAVTREGQPTITEKVYQVVVTMASGRVWTIEALTKEPGAHEKLLAEVIKQINLGLTALPESVC